VKGEVEEKEGDRSHVQMKHSIQRISYYSARKRLAIIQRLVMSTPETTQPDYLNRINIKFTLVLSSGGAREGYGLIIVIYAYISVES